MQSTGCESETRVTRSLDEHRHQDSQCQILGGGANFGARDEHVKPYLQQLRCEPETHVTMSVNDAHHSGG